MTIAGTDPAPVAFEGTSTVLCDLDYRIVLRTSQPPIGGWREGGGGVPSVALCRMSGGAGRDRCLLVSVTLS